MRRFCQKHLTPIEPEYDFSVENFIKHTNYSAGRKIEILRAVEHMLEDHGETKFHNGTHKYGKVKIFIKDESYPDYKYPRGIWARQDAFKAICGPIFRAIEEKVFKLPYFIKKIPKSERAAYIIQYIQQEGYSYQCTDYTSYESLFTTDLMEVCEFELYRFMLQHHTDQLTKLQMLFTIIGGINVVENVFFTFVVLAKRMSGEMNTSLGNGFSNLMFMLFAFDIYKVNFRGPVVEGDDGLAAVDRPIPKDYFIQMGLNVKMEIYDQLSEASFCGMVFDQDEMINIRDPIKVLVEMPYVPRRYAYSGEKVHFSLLKSKALSLLWEYPGCPILAKFGTKIIQLLSDFKIDVKYVDDKFQQELLIGYLKNPPPFRETGIKTRLLMEKVYGINVSSQIKIEEDISNMTLHSFHSPTLLSFIPKSWFDFYDRFSVDVHGWSYDAIVHPTFYRTHKPVNTINKIKKSSLMMAASEMLTFEQYVRYVLGPQTHLTSQQINERYERYIYRRRTAADCLCRNKQHIPPGGLAPF